MSCHHADTTAILALFGEADADFEDHLRGCAACQATVAGHRETIAVISPHLSVPAKRRLWPAALLGTIAAIAAALLLTVLPLEGTTSADLATVSDTEADLLDDGLLALELELALINLEDN